MGISKFLATLVVCLLSANVLAAPASEGALWENRHVTKHVKTYEGTKSCIECHDEEA